MSQKEITRLEVITKYLGRGFNQTEAARHLGVSPRHFRRLVKDFEQTGADSLISKHRGQPSNHLTYPPKSEPVLKRVFPIN